jgi:hypothetical protein
MYGPTCFECPHANHQELNNCSSSLWFYHWSVVVAVLLVGPTGIFQKFTSKQNISAFIRSHISAVKNSYSVETGRKSAVFKGCPSKCVSENGVPNCELNLARLRCYIIVETAVCWDMEPCRLVISWPNFGWISCLHIVGIFTSCPGELHFH